MRQRTVALLVEKDEELDALRRQCKQLADMQASITFNSPSPTLLQSGCVPFHVLSSSLPLLSSFSSFLNVYLDYYSSCALAQEDISLTAFKGKLRRLLKYFAIFLFIKKPILDSIH